MMYGCVVDVDRTLSPATAAAADIDSLGDDANGDNDDDDDEYGFDPKLHVWHPPEDPVAAEERLDGKVFFVQHLNGSTVDDNHLFYQINQFY